VNPSAITTGLGTTATASCPGSSVLLGGGGRIIHSGGNANDRVRFVLKESYPSSTTTWTVSAMTVGNVLSATNVVSVQAFAICTP
jgi:hypothetical protein